MKKCKIEILGTAWKELDKISDYYLLTVDPRSAKKILDAIQRLEAFALSGINVKKVLVTVYMLSGLLIALAAMVEASRLGSMNSASSGISYDMDAIAAVVIGGTSMSGGHGRIVGTFF